MNDPSRLLLLSLLFKIADSHIDAAGTWHSQTDKHGRHANMSMTVMQRTS